MKLEVGRTYKARNGDKVTLVPTTVDGCVAFGEPYGLYLPDGKFGYMEDGRHVSQCHDLDLIAEWTDEPTTGTLQELNVKPGDVVEMVSIEDGYTKPDGNLVVDDCGRAVSNDGSFFDPRYDRTFSRVYRIISRTPTTQSPVRTVTRTSLEIVPGVYGPLNVIGNIGGLVSMQIAKEFLTKDEVDELLDNLTAIKEAME